ncbi:NAD(P)-binding protein [Favolaschia claudopus]|uniref:NAD(P)-binding protein n=1 Tax=Favolaschia claudopus TaxID=2862362 RepID=A0AAV9Z1W8_9AGAR
MSPYHPKKLLFFAIWLIPNFLENRRVLIIGGSSGLGFAVASAALANGSRVHITSMTASKLSSKISTLQSLYPGAHVSGSVTDLSSTETLEGNLQSVLEAATKETGEALDHIAFTAGDSAALFPLAEATVEKALKPFTVRYLSSLLVGKLVAANPDKYLKSSASSSITFTSGIGVRRPSPGAVALVGVGGAVEVLSRSLAVDLAPIRVNVVVFGRVDTELLQKSVGGRPQVLEKLKAGTLTGQIGTPEGAAEAYLFCMRSALATGQDFVIDNGTMAK